MKTLVVFNVYIISAFVQMTRNVEDTFKINNNFRGKLDEAERNEFCCRRNLRCCKRTAPPSIEIRAILTRCPNTAAEESVVTRNLRKPITSVREHDLTRFQGFDEDEPLLQSEVVKCHKKLIITMKITNEGLTNLKSEFVVVDHVYDPVTEKRTRLLNPYVIKIKQDMITQMYGLRFQHVVNSEAKEVVFNKHDGNYTGCDTTLINPTCGAVKYHGRIIPYSTGFCCSCDALKNSERQPYSPTQNNIPIISYSDPSYLLDGNECPHNMKNDEGEAPEYTKQNDEENAQTVKNAENKCNNNHQIKEQSSHSAEWSNKDKPEPPHENRKHRRLFKMTTPNDFPFSRREYHDRSVLIDNQRLVSNKRKMNATNRQTKFKINGYGDAAEPFNIGPSDLFRNHFVDESYGYSHKMDRYISTMKDFSNHASRRLNEKGSRLTHEGLGFRGKRQVVPSGSQLRGGQDCADRYTPPKVDPETYHDSTHCLRFSDLWYTVYQLQKPIIDHALSVQIFEKHEDENGLTRWRDLTRGKVPKVGTFNSHYTDKGPTISIYYKSVRLPDGQIAVALNYKNVKLLVPENANKLKATLYPEITNGPSEYMIVHPSQLSIDGDQCNVAGVGFEAFFKQPNRCSMPRGSCLLNQPKHLWQHDHNAKKKGVKGCFFLEHYGELPVDPIRNNSNGDMFLALGYLGQYTSTLDLEIKADFNTVLRPQSAAKITEVYIDSTSPTVTNFIIKITNSGLTSSSFSVSISDCPLDMPATLNNIKSKQALIPPQHQHIFNLQVKFVLPSERFYCSVEAFNFKDELVALRRIRIQKYDRCICTWHCLCACVGSLDGLKCKVMSLEHYHAAGFQGSLPITTLIAEYTFLDDMISLMFYIFVFFCLVLLILGLTKAIVGCCCCPQVGMWGLDVLLDLPKKMQKYHEYDIRNREVVYDETGWPIHPDTKRRVRNTSVPTEFCMNVLFFYTYPISIFTLLIQRLCCPYYTYVNSDDNCACKVHNSGAWDGARPKKRTPQLSLKSDSNNYAPEDYYEELMEEDIIKEETELESKQSNESNKEQREETELDSKQSNESKKKAHVEWDQSSTDATHGYKEEPVRRSKRRNFCFHHN